MTTAAEELAPKHNQALIALTGACLTRTRPNLPLPGATVFQVDRSPDYFAFLRALRGSATVLGVLEGDAAIATASVVRRQVTWRGGSIEAHYICDLKVHPAHRKGRAAFRMFKAIAELCGGRSRYAFVQQGNSAALPLLRGRAGFGSYEQADRVGHFMFASALPAAMPRGYEVAPVTPALTQVWLERFLDWRRGRNLVLEPGIEADFGERRFLVTYHGRPAAVGSLVDQSAVRRFVATKLSCRDQVIRWGLNGVAALRTRAAIPPPGRVYRRAYIADLLYDQARPEAVTALVAHGQRVLDAERTPFLYVGLSEREPAYRLLARRRGVHRFHTVLLTTAFPPGGSDLPTFVNLHEL